ncbi:MAG: cobalamin biosynthesis protein CbiG, partial [Pseudomonadota bacterium]|nr:cobalamin biosynthesis protein CbiG [Pseudomonadota bacterium]
ETDLAGVEVVAAEVYPSLIKPEPLPGEIKDQAQVRTLCQHFAKLDEAGKLGAAFGPAKDFPADAVLDVQTEEGWVLGA